MSVFDDGAKPGAVSGREAQTKSDVDRVVDARCPGGQTCEDEVAELCCGLALGQVWRKRVAQIVDVRDALQLRDAR